MKFIFLIVAILLIWWILKTLNRSRVAEGKPRIRNMLPCTHCGLHIPEDEAIRRHGKPYCCMEHAEKDNQ